MKSAPAKLTTHVLDTAHGCPAEGVRIELWSLDGPQPRLLKTATTNADGRLPEPLLAESEMRAGVYELVFHAGDYFTRTPDARKSLPASPQPSSVIESEQKGLLFPILSSSGEERESDASGLSAIPRKASLFLDRIPVRFRIADASVSYHIPLLMSPWSYTTYRGS